MARVKRDTPTHRLTADLPVDQWPVREAEVELAKGEFPVDQIDVATLTGFRARLGDALVPVVAIEGFEHVFPIQPYGADGYPQFTKTGVSKDAPTFYANAWGAKQAAGVGTLGHME